MRLNPAADLHINAFNGAVITELESGITNGLVEKRGDVVYLTQRPSIDVFEDADTHVSDARGRALIYWDETTALYIMNNDTVYKSSQSNSISTTPTAGTKKCHFLVLGANMVLLDPENNQGFQISNSDTLTEITDTDFPPKQTPAVGLAFGGAVLNNALYVLGENGTVYGSDSGDSTAWNSLNFLEASRDPDAGVFLGRHHDNIAAYGSSTIEFFYDAGNATGSPLSRRQDVSYQIGCASGESVWEEGDRSFFVGVNFSGAMGVYTLEQFAPRKVSTATLDSFLTQSIAREGFSVVGSGVAAHGHIFYFLTVYSVSGDIVPSTTFVYDDTTGLWGDWETSINDITKLPIVDWTKRRGPIARFGEGILSNGDLITLNDNMVPTDTILAAIYMDTDYVDTGYVLDSGASGTSITMKSRMGMTDNGTNLYKYPLSYRQVSDLTPNTQTLTLRWADESNASFTSGKSLDTSIYVKAYRNGRFRRRNHELEYSGSDIIRIEAIEAEIPVGDN